jgi:hypothetical protein
MRERVRLKVSVKSEVPNCWRLLVEQLILPLQPIEVEEYPLGYDYVFDYYPENIELVQARLKEIDADINSSVWVSYNYTRRELLAAEFLMFGGGRLVHSRTGSLSWECRTLCGHCGFQEVVWNLQDLKLKDAPRGMEFAYVDHHPRIVSATLAAELISSGFTGLELPRVGQDEPPMWYGVQSTCILPPVQVPPTRLKHSSRATPACLLSHALASRHSAIVYQREGFNAQDFAYSYEYYGESCSGGRELIISNRVYRRLLDLRIRNFSCSPIRFVD